MCERQPKVDYGCNTFKGGLQRSRKKKSPTKSSTLYGKRNKCKALGQGQMAWLISYRSVRRKIRRWGQGDQRKKHVDRLMGVAMKYEDFCMTC